MSTEENLKEAFAGESQANRTYLAFAKKADEDGKPGTARLFRAVAEAETIHALNHIKQMNKVSSTADNLKTAKEGENYEHTQMYPKMIEEAEDNPAAKLSFHYANEVEKLHENLYNEALEKVNAGGDFEVEKLYVCKVCGFTAKEKPDVCPICSTTGFTEVI